jgi:hypothetical protein
MRILLNFVHEEDLYYYKCKYVYPGQSKSMTQCSLRHCHNRKRLMAHKQEHVVHIMNLPSD